MIMMAVSVGGQQPKLTLQAMDWDGSRCDMISKAMERHKMPQLAWIAGACHFTNMILFF